MKIKTTEYFLCLYEEGRGDRRRDKETYTEIYRCIFLLMLYLNMVPASPRDSEVRW